ncbi:hypothetical protein GQ457_03G019670 [Hibiscus cannabinus]
MSFLCDSLYLFGIRSELIILFFLYIWYVQAANIETETFGIHDGDYQLSKHEYSDIGRGKYSGSTTEFSGDIEKQELEDVSDEDETSYYDTKDYFVTVSCVSI